MKKIFLISLITVLLSGCAVGTHSVSSGIADVGSISFTYAKKCPIQVIIDNNANYNIETVKYKPQKSRNIKKTIENTISVAPGKHKIEVKKDNQTIYTHTVFISTNESKIINL